eukprot:2700235-Rhodomonas_salina.3
MFESYPWLPGTTTTLMVPCGQYNIVQYKSFSTIGLYRGPVLPYSIWRYMVLCACYAMSASSGRTLLASYALSGTDIGYAATRQLRDVRLCCYSSATQYPVLTRAMLLPGFGIATGVGGRVPPMLLRARYAMSGTDLGYAPTRSLRDVWSALRYLPTRALRDV